MANVKLRKPLVVVFVGEKLSGKEEASRYLARQHRFVSFRFSQILVDILERLHLPVTRVNEMNLVGGLRERFGGGVLADVIKDEIKRRDLKRVVIDGLRHPGEYDALKAVPGFLLVYLTAPFELRYERARRRGEKVGEKDFTRQEFKREETLPTEIFIRGLGRRAKVKLVNDGSLKKLHQQIVEKIIKKYRT